MHMTLNHFFFPFVLDSYTILNPQNIRTKKNAFFACLFVQNYALREFFHAFTFAVVVTMSNEIFFWNI